jgi:hypothetical protein
MTYISRIGGEMVKNLKGVRVWSGPLPIKSNHGIMRA